MSSRSAIALALAPWLMLTACSDDEPDPGDDDGDGGGSEPDAAPQPEPDAAPEPPPGMVFALGNQAEGNDVVAFTVDDEGGLTEVGSYPTGGLGTGEGIGSQAALVFNDDRTLLFVVNPGSDEISSLHVFPDHLALADVVSSGGANPISLAARGDRLYVLNADGAGSVSGFAVGEGGELTAIEGATRPLSSDTDPTDPAQVGLSPDGSLLVVSEKGTSRLTSYAVADDGSLGEAVVTESSGQVPFGFAFTPSGTLVVSEAGGGPAGGGPKGTSAVSSYAPQPDGTLEVISGSVPSGQMAACWIQLAGDARYAYATNAQSNTISGYQVAKDGSLTLFDDGGATLALGAMHSPIDMAVSGDDAYLYALAGAADVIVAMRIEEDGGLTRLADTPVPATAVGLVGF